MTVLVSGAVSVEAAGDAEGDERAARQGVRAAGCDGQRAGDHQRETGAGEQGLAAEDRQVIHCSRVIITSYTTGIMLQFHLD